MSEVLQEITNIFTPESVTEAVRIKRVSQIILNNPIEGDKTATFKLDDVTIVGNSSIINSSEQHTVILNKDTYNNTVKTLNPSDNDAVIGEFTYGEYFIYSYSIAKDTVARKILQQKEDLEARQRTEQMMAIEEENNRKRRELAQKQEEERLALESQLNSIN